VKRGAPRRTAMKRTFAFALAAALTLVAWSPRALADDTDRSSSWQTVTSITAVSTLATQLLMPRVFYSDPETTVGWKARWHVSSLAPAMTLTALTMFNEYSLKSAIASPRPGCNDANQGTGHCLDYGSLSSHTFLAVSSFAQGTTVFLVDTYKWSDGRFNGAAFAGDVALPLVLAGVTAIGRSAGNWESGGSVLTSSVAGLGVGVLTGLTYAMMSRPECSYTGALICW
jgi:hypothetical protein